MKVRSIHPFPARMAPDLALVSLENLSPGSTVLDPMVGSGTVARHALELGHHAIGYDMDPLAVLMSKVWTTEVLDRDIEIEFENLMQLVAEMGTVVPALEWHCNTETAEFVDYWFYEDQRSDLSRIAAALEQRRVQELTPPQRAALDVLCVAFSRIIITKEQGASLARDTSHSRPHRVATVSKYEVVPNFERSVRQLRKRLLDHPPKGAAHIGQGDARSLTLSDCSIDAVVTSPPYLNAIDYMRGHRMALVWLGHSIPALRNVRSTSIGAERAAGAHDRQGEVKEIAASMRGELPLSNRLEGIVARYALDLIDMTSEVARVLKGGGRATFVVGNSCIKGRYIDNAKGVATAARRAGMEVLESRERDLPTANRYLPVSGDSLSKRMRTETVLVCRKPVVGA